MNCKNIIGIESAVAINLIKKVNSLSKINIIEKYWDIFNGLGCLQNHCNLLIKNDVETVVEPPRKLPYKLYESLKDELHRMVNG